ncbi:hypothetical protein M446_6980 (plasmid) [Methylobacterium sp. 4-46]|uniref:hypothetical protein n=1 Tax=unclassified Methylobacterium TaxID=2615210 RepID=UPI000152D4E3|nr:MULTISPECIES: hypothetical protein [Methylobacterium]ACA21213.1 hypothetical protein M446_6980 [Methylobacterium sp. 4-46]WFT83781.1 hypothetical protein QA634_35495 [Methylobacterium nodulans]
MAEEWFTYSALGERLGISPEAARQKAIRNHWPRRAGNDGKAQVRVDIEEVIASTIPRKPREEEPSDACPTPEALPVEPPSDARTFAALEEHIATLKAMAAKAEEIAERERQRADQEGVRADAERARADAERARANELVDRITQLQNDERASRATIERELSELRGVVDRLKRPWWRRLAG